MKKRIEAAEMWFLRRMLRISWIDKVSNEEVLRKARVKRNLMKVIRKKQMQFLGHAMRSKGMQNLMLTGKIEENQRKTTTKVYYQLE